MVSASVIGFAGLIALVALQRLLELRLAKRNSARARAAGATEAGASHYPWMVLMHGAFLVSSALEVILLDRPFIWPLAFGGLVVLGVATVLRYLAIRSLGERWTTRVFRWPDRPLVRTGPYRLLRHPNYVAVALEIVALPLVHSAWATALVFSILNAWLLSVRIRIENAALATASAGVGDGKELDMTSGSETDE